MNWQQFQTIVWLRWRLSRNQWSRGGTSNLVATLIVVVLAVAIGIGGAIGGTLAGAFALAKAPPEVHLLVWDGVVTAFLFFWLIGIVAEVQRSESIDIGRLLHLPVTLKEVFLFNYFVAHLSLILILFVPGMIGTALGLVFAMSPRMMWLPPLILGFIFMVTAWTYCLRGWLVALMTNQRRRRTVIMVLTFSLVLLGQLPNLYFNVLQRHARPNPRIQARANGDAPGLPGVPARFFAAHRFVPPLWVGLGAMSLARGSAGPALFGTAGCVVIGALGLLRAYRSTVRFYQGGGGSRRVARVASCEAVPAGTRQFLELRLPLVPDPAGALGLAFFRSMLRAPEVKMALGGNLIGILLLAVTFLTRGSMNIGQAAQFFVATAAVAVPFLGLLQLMFNLFGLDREGFRALVLLPAERKHILLGKNLAYLPFALGTGLLLLALAEGLFRLPLPFMLAACLQLAALFLLLSAAGNLASILAPYRVAPGSLKPTKTSASHMLLIFLWQLLFPLAMVPVFIPAALGLLAERLEWMPGVWLEVILSAVIAGLAVLVYRVCLTAFGRLLQRREMRVLEAVTQEVE